MTIENQSAATTVAAGIYYDIKTYKKHEIFQPQWEQLCYYLKIDKSEVYCIERTYSGFCLTTKNKIFNYTHSDYHNERVVKLIVLVPKTEV